MRSIPRVAVVAVGGSSGFRPTCNCTPLNHNLLTVCSCIGQLLPNLTGKSANDTDNRQDQGCRTDGFQDLRANGDTMVLYSRGLGFPPPYLLEVGELRDLHPVQPHLPAQTPGAKHRGLPVVLNKPARRKKHQRHKAHTLWQRGMCDDLAASI